MSISNILAPLSGSTDDTIVLATAFAAAKPFGAHVSALCVCPDAREVAYAPDLRESINDREMHAIQARRDARMAFADSVRRAGALVSETAVRPGVLALTASYKDETGRLSHVVAANSLFADLIVFPPLRPPVHPALHDAFVRTLMTSGKPLLLSPRAAPKLLGTKIGVAWDGGLPAKHALLASMPLLEMSGDVELLFIGPRPMPGKVEVDEYLSLHGVKVRVRAIEKPARPVGEALSDAASGCDLLVVGGYGHSRMVETIFGGTTEYVTSHADIPILMSH